MFKSVKYLIMTAFALLSASCSNTNKVPVIMFSEDSTSIVVKNIDAADLYVLKRNSGERPVNQGIISVVTVPDERDSLQDEIRIQGNVYIQGDSVLFRPELPFVKNKTYLVESYISSKFADKNKLFKGTVKYNFKPQSQLLKR